jgi:hypothetical protein
MFGPVSKITFELSSPPKRISLGMKSFVELTLCVRQTPCLKETEYIPSVNAWMP